MKSVTIGINACAMGADIELDEDVPWLTGG
jgi:hypothetical protein